MRKVIRRESREISPTLAHLHPVLQSIYGNRQIDDAALIEKNLHALQDFRALTDIDKASRLLAESIIAQQRILIIGDYDADGATSTAVAMQALRRFGARHVDYLVPSRFKFGYGLTPEIVEVARELNPDLIITVDNGIASHDGVLRA